MSPGGGPAVRAGADGRRDGVERRSPALVFVCLVFHPDTSASSLLFTDLFRALADDGARITVLTGFPSKDSRKEVKSLPRREVYSGIEIIRCGLRIRGKRNLPSRALAYGSFLLAAGIRLGRSGGRATVVGATDPPFMPVALWIMAHLADVRYECVLLDIYPDGLVALGALKERSFAVRLWRGLNRKSFLRAQRLIVIGQDMVELLERNYRVRTEHVTHVPLWATREIDSGPAASRGRLLNHLGIADRFVVQYSGNMGLWHDIDTLVRAADRLRDDHRIHFLFIGKGIRHPAARALSVRLGLTNVTWIDFLPRDRLLDGLSSCDVTVISLRHGLNGVAVPSKLYGILAVGRPVIAQVPDQCEAARVVIESSCGVVVAPGNVDALAEAVQGLAGDPVTVSTMGLMAREAYDRKYTIDRARQAFEYLWLGPGQC